MSIFYSLASSFPTGFQTAVDSVSSGDMAGLVAALMAFMVVFVIIGIAVYIYSSLALMKIADRTNTPFSWLAWIPIGNLYLTSNIAGMHWWPILLFIPYVILSIISAVVSDATPLLGMLFSMLGSICMLAFSVFNLIWWYKICEKRERPGWWALLTLIPFFGIFWMPILMGILAWSKE